MGWDVAIWGSLELPEGQLDAWLDLVVDGSRWKGWKLWFENPIPGKPRRVKDHLAEWKKLTDAGRQAFAVELGKDVMKVSGLVPKEVFVGRAQEYVAVFRCADALGARGTVTFVGVAAPLTYRLTLPGPGKKSTFTALAEDLETTPEVMQIIAAAGASYRETAAAKKTAKKTATAKKGAKAGGGTLPASSALVLPSEASRALDAVHAKLAEVADRALVAAARAFDRNVHINGDWRSLEEAFPTAEALRSGLRGAQAATPEDLASAHRAAIGLLAKIDREAAAPLVRRLAAPDVPPQVRWGAIEALTGAKDDALVDMLLDVFEAPTEKAAPPFESPPPLRSAAERALVGMGRPDVGARMLALLTDKALAIKAGVTGDYVHPSAKEKDRQDLVTRTFRVIGELGYRPAWDRLAGIMKGHHLREVRRDAARALFKLARPEEIRGAFGEDPVAFMDRYSIEGQFAALDAEKLAKKLVAYVNQKGRKG
jgi:HEAT repeat protein